MPKSVLPYELDKVRYLDLEYYLIPVLFSQIKKLMIEIELNIMEWMLPLWVRFWDQYSLLLQYEILEELVTFIEVKGELPGAVTVLITDTQILAVQQLLLVSIFKNFLEDISRVNCI